MLGCNPADFQVDLDRHFTNSPDLLCIADTSGRFIRLNPQWEKVLGFPLAELEGRPFLEFMHPEDQQPTVKAVSNLLAQKEVLKFLNRYRCRDGTYRWLEWNSFPAGNFIYAVARDVTEQKRAESALRETEYFLTKSQEVTRLGSYKFDIVAGVWSCTRVLDEIFGIDDRYPKDINGWLQLVVPEQREDMRQHLLQHVVTLPHRFEREYRIIRHNDRQERWVRGFGELDFDAQGHPLHMIGTIQDVTERKRAEEALRLANRQLRMLSDCNEALVRSVEETGLFRTVCRIAIEIGGYRMVWVGLAEDDAARTVRPVAWAGVDDGYIARANISWADTKHGRGPIGIAIRTGRPCPVQNILDDPGFAPWRLEAAKRGFASACALPLTANGRTFGSLCVYSSQPDAFDTAEAALLQKLADNLAFGIAALRARQEREQAEQHRRDAEGLYRTIFQTSPDGIVLLDLEGRVTFLSPKAIEAIGVSAMESVTGRPITDFIAAEDHVRVQSAFARVLKEQYRSSSEYVVVRPDGSRFVGEFNAALLHDAEGRPKGVLVIMRDTTERRQAEEALRSSERKLAEIFRASPEFISVSTVDDGRILEFNETFTKLLGFERAEVIGRTTVEIELWPTPADRVRAVNLVRERGRVRNLDVKWRKKSGELIEVLMSMAPITVDGQACLITIATDIGELKRAEQARLEMERQLLHAQKLESLGVRAGGIAHDFNNLLMAILGNLDLALMDLSPVSPARSSIEQSAIAARRAADLTRQMLAYSGRASFDIRQINLSELVAENAHLFRACISKIVVLNVHLDHDLPLVNADSGQIQQVIMNLITNASEAIGDRPGAISLSTGL